ncbi:MAG: hypothetical protein QM705_07385 [Ancrocorticia sp.]
MSISYEAFDEAIECRAIREGVPIGTAAMRTFALAAMAVAVDIPESLRPGLVAGLNRWFVGMGSGESLMSHRIAAWEYLEQKNGSSGAIVDDVDRAVRILIYLLWDEGSDDGDLSDGLDFLVPLLNQYGGLERVLGMQGW